MSLIALATLPDIATDFAGFSTAFFARRQQYLINCPVARTRRYYLSNSLGNNGNDGLTEGSAFQTLAQCKSVIMAEGSDVRFSLRRDDIWRETTGIVIANNAITLDTFGTGNRPFLNRFTLDYLSAGWTNVPATTVYSRSETNDIAYLCEKNDRYGVARGTHLIRLDSLSAVTNASYSFWYDPTPDLLYVNMGGVNPNTIDFEAVISNYNVTKNTSSNSNGVEFQGDGCLCLSLQAEGWGIHRTQVATQDQNFTNRTTGNDANHFVDCVGYYSNTHVAAHHQPSGSGGRSLWEGCTFGLGQVDPAFDSCSLLNSYSSLGAHECLEYNNTYQYGALKEYTWSYATWNAAIATGFLSHTGGGSFSGLSISWGCRGVANPISMVTGLHFDNSPVVFAAKQLQDCRAFSVNGTLEPNPNNHRDTSFGFTNHSVHYGITATFKPNSATLAGGWMNIRPVNCYIINSNLITDCTSAGNNYALWNGLSGDAAVFLWHTLVQFINQTTAGADGYALDFDMIFSTVLAGLGTSQGSEFINSILSYSESGGAKKYLGLNNNAALIKNNGYYQVDNNATVGQARNYDNDAGKVILASAPALQSPHSTLLGAGSTSLLLSHDYNGKRRTALVPDIGPVDLSSIVPADQASMNFLVNFATNIDTSVLDLDWAL